MFGKSRLCTLYNHTCRYDMPGARRLLGVCPQHDVLFDDLTVEQHLIFFCRLKGVAQSAVAEHVNDMIGSLNLESKRHAFSKTLSGGQKRRLSCGMAIIGGSKVIILDEPTSGVDPAARREIWELIIKYKEGRTFLVSTHFMDEADVLGDRVAIMADGVLKCCGSPSFLKKHFADGYTISMVKGQGCNPQAVLEFVQRFAPEA